MYKTYRAPQTGLLSLQNHLDPLHFQTWCFKHRPVRLTPRLLHASDPGLWLLRRGGRRAGSVRIKSRPRKRKLEFIKRHTHTARLAVQASNVASAVHCNETKAVSYWHKTLPSEIGTSLVANLALSRPSTHSQCVS